MTSTDETKRRLRQEMRARRDAVEARDDKAAAILARAAPLLPDGAVVGGYVGVGSEVDPMPLMARLAGDGCTLALPVAAKDSALAFRTWRPGETLEPGAFRVPEPVGGDAVTPTVLLVPLLAFDDACFRLGQGGGHYDRTLAALAPVRAIGLAFEAQRVAHVPRNRFDRRLDAIVTETRVIYVPGCS